MTVLHIFENPSVVSKLFAYIVETNGYAQLVPRILFFLGIKFDKMFSYCMNKLSGVRPSVEN
jgi:hypothetical protein